MQLVSVFSGIFEDTTCHANKPKDTIQHTNKAEEYTEAQQNCTQQLKYFKKDTALLAWQVVVSLALLVCWMVSSDFVGIANGVFGLVGVSDCAFSLVGVLDVFLSLVCIFSGVQSSKTQMDWHFLRKRKKRRENMHAVSHILVSYCIIVHRYTNLVEVLSLGDMQGLIGLNDGLLMVDSLPVSAPDMLKL